jgi:hypothetical protein
MAGTRRRAASAAIDDLLSMAIPILPAMGWRNRAAAPSYPAGP